MSYNTLIYNDGIYNEGDSGILTPDRLKGKYISPLYRRFLPEMLRQRHPKFQEFIRIYLEYLEQSKSPYWLMAHMSALVDIDLTVEEALTAFRNRYAPDFDFEKFPLVDKRHLMRNIKSFYAAKGTENSFKFLFRLLGHEVELYRPAGDLCILSEDSTLSGPEKLIDSYYWTPFTYDLISELPFEQWKQIVKDLAHPAGMGLFGTYLINLAGEPILFPPIGTQIANPSTLDETVADVDRVDISLDYLILENITDAGPPVTYDRYDFSTGTLVTLTTSGELPTPLEAGTDYYVVLKEVRTELSADFGNTDTIMPLEDISEFPETGIVFVGGEYISYTTKDSINNQLTGLTRGINDTSAANHLREDKVYFYDRILCLAESKAEALCGNVINITDAGTGTHTITSEELEDYDSGLEIIRPQATIVRELRAYTSYSDISRDLNATIQVKIVGDLDGDADWIPTTDTTFNANSKGHITQAVTGAQLFLRSYLNGGYRHMILELVPGSADIDSSNTLSSGDGAAPGASVQTITSDHGVMRTLHDADLNSYTLGDVTIDDINNGGEAYAPFNLRKPSIASFQRDIQSRYVLISFDLQQYPSIGSTGGDLAADAVTPIGSFNASDPGHIVQTGSGAEGIVRAWIDNVALVEVASGDFTNATLLSSLGLTQTWDGVGSPSTVIIKLLTSTWAGEGVSANDFIIFDDQTREVDALPEVDEAEILEGIISPLNPSPQITRSVYLVDPITFAASTVRPPLNFQYAVSTNQPENYIKAILNIDVDGLQNWSEDIVSGSFTATKKGHVTQLVSGAEGIVRGRPHNSTNLTSDVLEPDTTINVDNTDGFPSSGKLKINSEEMTYTGKTSTTFTGVVRGTHSSEVGTHLSGNEVSSDNYPTINKKLVYIEVMSGNFENLGTHTVSVGNGTTSGNDGTIITEIEEIKQGVVNIGDLIYISDADSSDTNQHKLYTVINIIDDVLSDYVVVLDQVFSEPVASIGKLNKQV